MYKCVGQALHVLQIPREVLPNFQHEGGPLKTATRLVGFGSVDGFYVVYFCGGAYWVLSGVTTFTMNGTSGV